jgi:uncharacterized protein (UPF0216 family)
MDSPTKQAILPAQEYVEILKRVLDMNEQIVKQNSLVIQSVTLPQLMVRPGEWVEVKP